MNVQDKVALVTGGASGLGAACASLLSEAGAKKVFVFDRDEEKGQKMAAEADNREFLPVNVTSEDEVSQALESVKKAGGPHIVINCAGTGVPEKLISKEGEPHSMKNFSKTVEVNLMGTFNITRLAATAMAQVETDPETQERGVIINTASIAAFEGQIGQIAYAASKGGIASMTLPMARELSRQGIRVMCIAPGTFDTPMMAGLPDNVRQALEKQIPFPSRLGKPQEFAELAAHIINNPMLNGETIRLDGAIRMPPK